MNRIKLILLFSLLAIESCEECILIVDSGGLSSYKQAWIEEFLTLSEVLVVHLADGAESYQFLFFFLFL
jgi:hypothetical protein